ncbi:hypothetical protein [Myxococcus sp. Y35]|uniref:hypothetical protein n=1 Tax=Pseudomyxococcus flavus TaxID=3115648 RepID=UPI003CE6E662
MSPSQEAQERLAVLEAEGKAMDEVLDSVEERLLGNQAMLQTWQELGRRHREVTQLHCESSNPHMVAMMKHYKKLEDRARQLRRRRGGVAAVDTSVLTSGKAPRGNN